MKKATILIAVALGALGLAACGSSSSSSSTSNTTASTTPATSGGSASSGGGSTVSLSASPDQLAFNTTSLSAKPGKVTVNFTNPASISHDVVLEDSSGQQVGRTNLISQSHASFTADLKPGTYTYFCDVPGHEQAGMKGTLTVK